MRREDIYWRYCSSMRYYNFRPGRWMSVDPLAKKYPGWSPYNYVRDNPATSIDPDGAQVKPKSLPSQDLYGNLNLSHASISLSERSEFNPASISANGFSSPNHSSFGKALVGFVQQTAKAATTVYFWSGVATGALAAGAAAFGQVEVSVPLGEASLGSFALAEDAAATNVTATVAQASMHMISWKRAGIRITGIAVGVALGHLVDLPYVNAPAEATNVAGKFVVHQTEEGLIKLGNNEILQPAQ